MPIIRELVGIDVMKRECNAHNKRVGGHRRHEKRRLCPLVKNLLAIVGLV